MPFPIMAAIAAAELIKSEIDKHKAKSALEEIERRGRPNYSVSPELQDAYTRAQDMVKYGTPAQDAAEQQQLVRSQNTAFQRARQSAPGFAQQFNAGLNYVNAAAQNQIAARKEQRHLDAIHYADSLGKAIQGQKNLASGADIQNYNFQQQAFGGAIRNQNENLFKALNMAGTALGGSFGGGARTEAPLTGAYDPVYDNMMKNVSAPSFEQRNEFYNPTLNSWERARQNSLIY